MSTVARTTALGLGLTVILLMAAEAAAQASRMPPQGPGRGGPHYRGPFGQQNPGSPPVSPPVVNPPASPSPSPAPAPSGGPSTSAPRGRAAAAATGGSGVVVRRRRAAGLDLTPRWETWWEWNKERFLGIGRRRRLTGTRSDAFDFFRGRSRGDAARIRDLRKRLRSTVLLPALRRSATAGRQSLRVASVYALGLLADREAVVDLVHALSDGSRQVRETAVVALGMAEHAEAVAMLTEVLEGRLPGRGDGGVARATLSTRGLAALALGLTRDARAIGPLRSTAFRRSTPRELRAAALLGLGLVPDAEARKHLLRGLKVEWFGITERAVIASALGFQAENDVLDALYRLMRDRRGEVRRAAVLAVGSFPRQSMLLGNLLQARDRLDAFGRAGLSDFARQRLAGYIDAKERAVADERKREAAAWGKLRNTLRYLVTKDADRAVRAFALVSLGQVGEMEDADVIGRRLLHGEKELRGFAALGLGLLARAHPKKKAPLVRLLGRELDRSSDLSLRAALALAAGLAGDRQAGDRMAKWLDPRTAPSLRGHVASALGLLGQRRFAPAMAEQLVRARDIEEIQNTALGLSLIGGPRESEVLRRTLLTSRDTTEQIAVGVGLAFLGGRPAFSALVRFLGTPSRPTAARAFVAEGIGLAVDQRDPTPLARITAGYNFLLRLGPVERIADLKW